MTRPRQGIKPKIKMDRIRAGQAASLAIRTAKKREKLDRFAENLSETGCIWQASDYAGVTHAYGKELFALIRKELGPQAV